MEYIESITPHIPSKNIEATIDFMVDAFGFISVNHREHYYELILGNQTLGILQALGDPGQQSIYLRGKDVDVLCSEIKDTLEQARSRAPFNQPYGMREFHVGIPGTNTLLFVGSPIQQ